MARQFRSDDAQKWFWGFGVGAPLDLTLGTETASWNGTTRFSAYGSTTGTAGTKTLTNPGGWSHKSFHLIHQTCNSAGTNVGNWEIQYINWSLGSNQCMFPLQYSYLTGAQVISLSNSFTHMPRDITVTGTFKPPSWNGSTGGIIALMSSRSIVVNNGAILDANGGVGSGHSGNGSYAGGATSGAGFRGGGAYNSGSGCVLAQAESGETWTGTKALSVAAWGNGGGGGRSKGSNCGAGYYSGGGGGGGANAAGGAGTTGSSHTDGGPGAGGVQNMSANTQNTNMMFGGGGGGSSCAAGGTSTGGGQGGGIILLIAPTITFNSGSIIRCVGGAGGANGMGPASGGGGGGCIVLKGNSVNIGTNLVTAQGGAGGVATPNNGGAGGAGKLAVDYKTSMTGSTTLAGTNYRQDTSLNPFSMGGGAILL